MRAGHIQALLCFDPDRLSRKMAHLMLLTEELENHHVALHFVNSPTEDTPEGKMLFGIRGVFAEYEHAKIVERTRRGREQRVKSGKQFFGGLPYGFTWVKTDRSIDEHGHLEVEPGEASIVQLIFKWVGKERCTLYEVAKRLYNMGIPTKKGCKHWRLATLQRIITNELYAGTAYFNKTEHIAPRKPHKAVRKQETSSQVARPRDQWLPMSVPAIVDRELWEAAQQTLARNKHFSKRKSKREYLLSGFVYCGKCGCRMRGNSCASGERVYSYYECGGRRPSFSKDEGYCTARPMRADLLNEAVWDTVLRHLANPDWWKQDLEEALKQQEQNTNHYDDDLSALYDAELSLQRQEDKLIELYQADGISLEKFKGQNSLLQRKLAAIQSERASIVAKKEQMAHANIDIDALTEIAQAVQVGLPPMRTIAQKRRALELLHSKVHVGGEEKVFVGDGPERHYAGYIEGLINEAIWDLPLPDMDRPTDAERVEGEWVVGFGLGLQPFIV